MAEIFDFGFQKYRLKLNGVYNQSGLFAVVGDTARRVEVQLLDAAGRVTDTTGIELSLSTAVGQSSSYVDANLIDASKGLYQVDLTNGLFLKPGNQEFQWTIHKDGKQINSVISRWRIHKNVSDGGNQSFNFYLNVDDLKRMQQDFIDGTVKSEALRMSLEERYSNLEADYAQDLSELKQNDADLTAQLAQKANEAEVRESTDTLPIDVDEMNTRTKQLFTGGSVAVVGENAIGRENIKRKAVSPTETDFIDVETGVNLFNKNAYGILQGKYITSSGTFNDNEDYLISDFIEVNPNTEYRVAGTPGIPNVSNVYDGGKQLITVSSQTINTPHNARFIRIHMLKTQVDNVMLYEYKGVTQSFVPHKEDYKLKENIKIKPITNDDIEDNQISPEKLLYKELSDDFSQFSSFVGENKFQGDGLHKEVGLVKLTGSMIAEITIGSNVDAIVIRKQQFPNSTTWPATDQRVSQVLGEFDLGEVSLQTWDKEENVNHHSKSATNIYLFFEKGRFTLKTAREYLDNNNIEVHYTLEEPELVPYREDFSENTKQLIRLMLNPPVPVDNDDYVSDGKLNIGLPTTKVTNYTGFRVLYLTHDGVAYCEQAGKLTKTIDFETFEDVHIFDIRMDYVFKLQNGAIFVVLVNGDLWLSDENESNFTLLTDELGGQGHPTDTSRAYVYNNILLVGEYATPGTLGNRVFISTDYGKTFKISLLPEQADRIDHTHSIVYDPYEQLIWVATGDQPSSCRIFWSNDFGETWETHNTGSYRMTTIMPLPTAVLFGTDEPKILGTFKYKRVPGGVTPENFIAEQDFASIYNESAYIFGWTSQPTINHGDYPYAYFGTRISHDNTPVGVGKVGVWKTDGRNYLSLWEHDGTSSSQAPYGVSFVHEDSTGRVIITWTDYNTIDGYVYNNIVME